MPFRRAKVVEAECRNCGRVEIVDRSEGMPPCSRCGMSKLERVNGEKPGDFRHRLRGVEER